MDSTSNSPASPLESSFTPEQSRLLAPFCTSTTRSIFALKNLPEVIKGALFSRYSRSYLGLRELLLRDFIEEEEAHFQEISQKSANDLKRKNDATNIQEEALQKAQAFYDRILDGYGDDSIGELGGAHLAIENVSMLAAKAIEDKRIGGSPLEKSTRYIYFDRKVKGLYPYLREKKLMQLDGVLYTKTCDALFETYSKLNAPLTAHIEQHFPREINTPEGAYKAALRAKVLDCLRGLLPAGTLTNMGLFGNGRFFEQLLTSLAQSSLSELQEIASCGREELSKVIPSFIRRSFPGNRHFLAHETYQKGCHALLEERLGALVSAKEEAKESALNISQEPQVTLLEWDQQASKRIIASLLFGETSRASRRYKSFNACEEIAQKMSREEQKALLDEMAALRTNRRHKAPRAAEHCFYHFEIVADFGVWRDLQRHRMLTQEHQELGTDLGFTISEEVEQAGLLDPYREALQKAQEAHETFIARGAGSSAQYIVPMAYRMRWNLRLNLRALQWICELRSAPAGHIHYRRIAQKMVQAVCAKDPALRAFFGFVELEGGTLGRMEQEKRRVAKEEARGA